MLTVGCGDHLLAGFVSELTAGCDAERALAFSLAVATARALSPKMDEFDPAILKQLLTGISIETI